MTFDVRERFGSMGLYDLDRAEIGEDTLALVSREVAWTYRVIPVQQNDELVIFATIGENFFSRVNKDLEFLLNRRVDFLEAELDAVLRALERYYRR